MKPPNRHGASSAKRKRKSRPKQSLLTRRRSRFEILEPRLLLASDWTNRFHTLDVSNDGEVSPLDVLQVINRVNEFGPIELPTTRPASENFVDTNQDGFQSAIDALIVINLLTGANGLDYIPLRESNGFATSGVLPIELGQESGTRTLRLEVRTEFDVSDTSSAVEDLLLLYVVDPTDQSVTLLDRGTPGTALLAVGAETTELQPGAVRFDGNFVDIDLTGLGDLADGQLMAQLLNSDQDDASKAFVQVVSNTVDAEGVASPVFDVQHELDIPGDQLDTASLTEALDVNLRAENVRYDTNAGTYTAEVFLDNRGDQRGRTAAIAFEGLPDGVTLSNASGVTAGGAPYINMQPTIAFGGLGSNSRSGRVEVTFNNPANTQFQITPSVLFGPDNQSPVFHAVGDLNVMPGRQISVELSASDPDGDAVSFMLTPSESMPTTTFGDDGSLVIAPRPEEVGDYTFTAHATDGALTASRTINVTVAADPITSTRISGVVQNTAQEPLVGVPIELGAVTTTTDQNGEFQIEFTGEPPSDALFIRGEALTGAATYPFIAEKLPLLLHHELYAQVDNVISRPIYLPALDMANAQPIDPSIDVEVVVPLSQGEAPASVLVVAGTLMDQQGAMYDGVLSITEVPGDLTPAALPTDAFPSVVVTIQPGEMVFTEPAPLTLPNRSDLPAGTRMTLWSINPESGDFDEVGVGRVSDDGSIIETVSGGIRNSSWHYFEWDASGMKVEMSPFNKDDGCKECTKKTKANSEIELHTGALTEEHSLVTYSSLGQTRGLTLAYDSLRADPRPIMHFSFDFVPFHFGQVHGFEASATIRRGNVSFGIGQEEDSEEHSGMLKWSTPRTAGPFGPVTAGFQADLSRMPSGQYDFDILARPTGPERRGPRGADTDSGELLHVNSIDSSFGSGWDLAGLQRLVESPDGSVMLIDGDGSEVLFESPAQVGSPYQSPPGDFSTLEKSPSGTFRRVFKDQTVHQFNANHWIDAIVDRNGNETTFHYGTGGQLERITDPVGLETRLIYKNNKVTEIVDPADRRTTLSYDDEGNLVSITDPDQTHRTFFYDSRHHMVVEVDKRGHTESTVYDLAGRATESRLKDGELRQFDPLQLQGFSPSSRSRVSGAIAQFATPRGLPTASYTDANGNLTRVALDQRGQQTDAFDGEGAQTKQTRDANNLVLVTIDGNGNQTHFNYDDVGNITQIREGIRTNIDFPTRTFQTVVGGRQLVDVNGDGVLDAVNIPCFRCHTIDIIAEIGRLDRSFTFAAPIATEVVQRPGEDLEVRHFAVHDFNRDGHPDIVLIGAIRDAGFRIIRHDAYTYLGQPDGTFTLLDEFEVTPHGELATFDIFDATNDGNADVVATETTLEFVDGSEVQGVEVRVLQIDDEGRFVQQITSELDVSVGGSFGNANYSLVFDQNGDNRMDVLLGRGGLGGETAAVLLQGPQGRFEESHALPLGDEDDSLRHLAHGDINDDGNSDLLVVTHQRIFTQLSSGDGTFQPAVTVNLPAEPTFAELYDLNADQHLDLVAPGRRLPDGALQTLQVAWGDGSGTFSEAIAFPVTLQITPGFPEDSAGQLQFRDFDQDGAEELLLLNNVGIEIVELTSTGALITPQVESVDSTWVDDLDGDGNQDLLTGATSRQLLVAFGTDVGGFEDPVELANFGLHALNIKTVDLDGDGNRDVVAWLSRAESEIGVSVAWGTGNREFTQPQLLVARPLGMQIQDVEFADVDSDGVLDVITTSAAPIAVDQNSLIGITLGTGEREFSPSRHMELSEPSRYAVDLEAGDFNSDEFVDLMISFPFTQVSDDSAANRFALYTGRGDGTFSFGRVFLAGSPHRQTHMRMESADLDGNGTLDLVVVNPLSGGSDPSEVTVLLGDGTGEFPTRHDLPAETPFGVGIADWNGDGALDIAVGSHVGSFLTIFAGNGNGSFGAGIRFGTAAGASSTNLQSNVDGNVFAADVNRDGALDAIVNDVVMLNQGLTPGTTFTYDSTFNQLTSITDELGHQTLFGIDPANGNRLSTTEVLGDVGGGDDLFTRYTYTTEGLIDTMADPLGRVADFDYDSLGRLTKITLAVGTADETMQGFEYDDAGNQTAVIDGNGNRTEFEYDTLNRLTRITEADPDDTGPLLSPVTEFDYDENGNITRIVDPRNNLTTMEYDELDRLIQQTDADDNITRYDYDPAGNLSRMIDPLGMEMRYEYDTRNRRVASIDPDGGRTDFTYDNADNLLSLTDPVGNQTQFSYDSRNRMIRETDPLGEATFYTYDNEDNLLAKRDRNDRVTRFVYDDVDRLINEMWLNVDGSVANTINYTYDLASNLTSLVDDVSSLAFTYDALDRVKTVDNDGTTLAPQVVLSYVYDDVGNVLSVNDAIDGTAAGTTFYAYDALNRNTQITQTGTDVSDKRVDFVYNELGQYDKISRFSDLLGTNEVVETNYTYDQLNRLTRISHQNAVDEVLSFFDYEYDGDSRITQITDVDGVTGYTYDDRDQLTGAEHEDPSNPDESYQYDANGNRRSSHLHGNGYQTGPGNRLLSDGEFNYQYDDEGNMTRRTEIATGKVREVHWDHRNRLVAVIDRDNSGIELQNVAYAYDALDRRITKDLNGDVTSFVHEREDVIFDFDVQQDSGNEEFVQDQRYFHGPGIDQVLAQESGAALHWMLTDHLGTVRDLVDNTGVVANHHVHGSFGQLIARSNGNAKTRYQFTGREFDEASELYFNRARYFSPVLGRFISLDPLGFEAFGYNLYQYVFNLPTSRIDPTGLVTIELGVEVEILAGIGVGWFLGGNESLAISIPHPTFDGSGFLGLGVAGEFSIGRTQTTKKSSLCAGFNADVGFSLQVTNARSLQTLTATTVDVATDVGSPLGPNTGVGITFGGTKDDFFQGVSFGVGLGTEPSLFSASVSMPDTQLFRFGEHKSNCGCTDR